MNRLYRWVFGIAFAAVLPFAAMADDTSGAQSSYATAAPAADAQTPATQAVDTAPPTSSATAAKAETPPSPDKNYLLREFKMKGATITYIGRKYGLDGWLLNKDTDIEVVYTTLDNQGAVIGTLYGPSGDLETSKQLLAAEEKGIVPTSLLAANAANVPPPVEGVNSPKSRFASASGQSTATSTTAPPVPAAASSPPPAAAASSTPPSERLWKQVEGSSYLKYGSESAPPFYVVMDPQCHYCHDFYTTLFSKYLPDKLQLRVIPVGILSKDSISDAEKIMSSADPAKTWDAFEHASRSGLGDIKPADAAKIAANTQLINEWKFQGTPTCIYRSKDGKVKLVVGVPSDMEAVLADLGPS